MIYIKKTSKVSAVRALDGSDFYSKIFGNKHCRYNEGPLYYESLKNGDDMLHRVSEHLVLVRTT